jgi:hypothetical protein
MMEALRASAVPHPGKNILHGKVCFVNPYSGKGMDKTDCSVFQRCAGVASLFPKALLVIHLADLVIQLVQQSKHVRWQLFVRRARPVFHNTHARR